MAQTVCPQLNISTPGLRAVFRHFDLELCDGCGICAEQCSFNEIRLETRRGKKCRWPTAALRRLPPL